MWSYRGGHRPPFAVEPEEGQESVWDYPRPPRVLPTPKHVEVRHGARVIASSDAAVRVLETASPPTVYVPPDHVDRAALVVTNAESYCEWKGAARYWALVDAPGTAVAWSYPAPSDAFAAIRDYVAFYPGRVDCFLGGEAVRPQAGRYYGGWVTDDIVGPFKGEPGTGGW